jgi:hypothetical protein
MISLNAVSPAIVSRMHRGGATPQQPMESTPAQGQDQPPVDSFNSSAAITPNPAATPKEPWYKHPAVAPAVAAAGASIVGSAAMSFIKSEPETTSKLLVPATVAGLTLAGTAFASKMAKRQNAANQVVATTPQDTMPQQQPLSQQA